MFQCSIILKSIELTITFKDKFSLIVIDTLARIYIGLAIRRALFQALHLHELTTTLRVGVIPVLKMKQSGVIIYLPYAPASVSKSCVSVTIAFFIFLSTCIHRLNCATHIIL